ncbi:MAG: hypothetical protein PHH17_01235 [Candidatus Pacebacteria bacterium]|jgi:hypothetical protein|nr:hypothetical protein [Candidatus Paceibacterota bacterium]MDD3728948.1 hypothetical protein [Candidatus Paceibacterota bacterium]MDD4201564.1 hypothetical protein [Candidatus Paceibacterota bacterium]MDD4467186.1 hypothetical protein [Candidatus Paceibacterota bacterium]MDD4897376.1 hypothetical protein [Candidatus Paceibacterota bacterium]
MIFDYFYNFIFSLEFLIVIFFLIIIFFVCREILCWYWKINKIINLLEKIVENMKKGIGEKEEKP